ncbi:MAG: radical SAM protein, partial [Bacteroidales bacterium]|nr:radical SAM protein [Bacteroidales bacterium]
DGRFRSCELREPIGKIQDYDCDVQRIMKSTAMTNELKAIGHGHKANCWCTHGCWIMSSMVFSPLKMIFNCIRGAKATERLKKHVNCSNAKLRELEEQYHLDQHKLKEIGIL